MSAVSVIAGRVVVHPPLMGLQPPLRWASRSSPAPHASHRIPARAPPRRPRRTFAGLPAEPARSLTLDQGSAKRAGTTSSSAPPTSRSTSAIRPAPGSAYSAEDLAAVAVELNNWCQWALVVRNSTIALFTITGSSR